jgi:carbon storage regulator
MLVLTRKLDENVVIGERISIKVLNIDGNKVQLGIQAPSNVMIYRAELVEKVRRQNQTSLISHWHQYQMASKVLKGIFK